MEAGESAPPSAIQDLGLNRAMAKLWPLFAAWSSTQLTLWRLIGKTENCLLGSFWPYSA